MAGVGLLSALLIALGALLGIPVPGAEPANAPAVVEWQESRSVGTHSGGRLEAGVLLPPEGRHYLTWDFVRETAPNRPARRWGHARAVRATLRIARAHRLEDPGAPRVLIGDLSRPRGGPFGPEFGPPGHVSHQIGLDVDVYYPRADGREVQPVTAADIDRARSQDLVDRFVAAGASAVFVGPGTGLTGPPGVVIPLPLHDDHLHARFPARPDGR